MPEDPATIDDPPAQLKLLHRRRPASRGRRLRHRTARPALFATSTSWGASTTVTRSGSLPRGRCGVLTVEIEHVDAVTLEKLEKQGVDCEPKASTIMIIQDKYRQKNHFSKFGIPLPYFMEVDTLHSIEEAGERFGYPLMVKSKRLAYDGRGNAVAQNKEDLSSVVALIGVPIKTQSLLGLDSLLSIVQMPKGIPVATVAIGNAENAGLLAVRMLASRDPELYDRAIKYQDDLRDMVLEKAERLENIGWEEYLK